LVVVPESDGPGSTAGTLSDLIKRRRMTRRFSGDPVDLALVLEMCDTARRAPSAGYSQGSHLLVLHGSSLIDFWRVSGAGKWFGDRFPELLLAGAVVVPFADETAYLERYSRPDKIGHGLTTAEAWSVPYWLTDTAMVVQNLLLLVEERRLGALFFGLTVDPSALTTHFGVPHHMRPIGAVAIGVRSSTDTPSGTGASVPRRPPHQVIHVGTW